jgi:hypothetical protein
VLGLVYATIAIDWLGTGLSARGQTVQPQEVPLRLRRVFVPADKLEEAVGGNRRYLPVERELLERLLAGSAQPSSRLVQSTFEADLDDDSLVNGRATLQIVHQGERPSALDLGPMNLCLSDPVWNGSPGGPAQLGLHSDGQLVAIVRRTGELTWRWSLSGERREGGWIIFKPVFPQGPVTRLRLNVPQNWSVVSDGGSSERLEGSAPSDVVWQFELGGRVAPTFWVAPRSAVGGPPLAASVRSAHEYTHSLQGIRLNAEFAVDVQDDSLSV